MGHLPLFIVEDFRKTLNSHQILKRLSIQTLYKP